MDYVWNAGVRIYPDVPEMGLKWATNYEDGIKHGLSDYYDVYGRWVSSDCYKNGAIVERTPEQYTRYIQHGIEDANYLLEMSHCKK